MKRLNLVLAFILALTSTNLLSDSKNWPEMSLFHMTSSWQDHNAKDFKLENFQGHITIIAMVYTSCEHTCPLIISKLNQVKKALPKELQSKIKFGLISFDPDGDTPKVLNAFKKKRFLDDNWTLLTGKNGGIRKLAAVLGVSYKKEAEGVFSHSNVISVLGKNGVVETHIDELSEKVDDMAKKITQLMKQNKTKAKL